MSRVRVVVADDSPLCRTLLREVLEEDRDIEVVGEAEDGHAAIEVVAACRPQIMTLDIEMPRMDGLATVEQIMARTPVPIFIVTGRPSEQRGKILFEAVRRGALDVVTKPVVDARRSERASSTRAPPCSRVRRPARGGSPRQPPSVAAARKGVTSGGIGTYRERHPCPGTLLLCLGGPAAVSYVLSKLPPGFEGLLPSSSISCRGSQSRSRSSCESTERCCRAGDRAHTGAVGSGLRCDGPEAPRALAFRHVHALRSAIAPWLSTGRRRALLVARGDVWGSRRGRHLVRDWRRWRGGSARDERRRRAHHRPRRGDIGRLWHAASCTGKPRCGADPGARGHSQVVARQVKRLAQGTSSGTRGATGPSPPKLLERGQAAEGDARNLLRSQALVRRHPCLALWGSVNGICAPLSMARRR